MLRRSLDRMVLCLLFFFIKAAKGTVHRAGAGACADTSEVHVRVLVFKSGSCVPFHCGDQHCQKVLHVAHHSMALPTFGLLCHGVAMNHPNWGESQLGSLPPPLP